jgi:hypothetical protein
MENVMEYETISVVSTTLGKYTLAKKMDSEDESVKVTGTGMTKPRHFRSVTEATEFAQDQLLILKLENDLLIAQN